MVSMAASKVSATVFAIVIRISVRIVLGILFLLIAATSNLLAQTPETPSQPDRGVNPNGAYSASNIDDINLTNGNVSATIPLASLPPIAGGKLSWSFNAVYNSKLWDLKSVENPSDQFHSTKYTTQRLQRATTGGWTVAGKYQLSMQLADEDVSVQPCPTNDQSCIAALPYRYKMTLITPDGSRHELRPLDSNAQEYTGVGNQLWRNGYYNATPDTVNQAMKYYSYDGSHLWAVIHPKTDNIHWEVYMPDGTKVNERGDNGRQTIADTNGNKIEIRTETDTAGVITTHCIDIQTNREIKYQYDPANGGTGYVQYQSVGNNVWQTFTIHFGQRTLQGRVVSFGDRVCTTVGTTNHPALTVITSITLPVTEPNITRQYGFHYNSEDIVNFPAIQYKTSCTGQPQSITSSSKGMGALSEISMPTGAKIQYDYGLDYGIDDPWPSTADPINGAKQVPSEVIKEKRIVHDSQTDHWVYTIHSNNSKVEGPDGSVTSLNFFDHDPRQGGYMGGTTGFSGLVYRTNKSDKVKVEQQWEMKEFTGANHDTPDGRVGFNTVVKAEYTTVSGSNGVPDRMSAKVFEHDFNGNVTSTSEYDWVDINPNNPNQVPRDQNGVPTGMPAGATLLRVTTNSYYNPATSAGSSSIYANRDKTTATPLILNAPQETTVGGSDTQYFYDSQNLSMPPQKGNLTQISRLKSSAMWVNTTYTYDSFGNHLTITDPNLNRTDYVIDPNTHAQPTSITVYPDRFNETKKLMTTIAYDSSTGLEISRTDANGKTTDTDYTNQLTNMSDPFGRPGKVTEPEVGVRIGGSVTTQRHTRITQYHDNTRRIEVWSDMNSHSDGKLRTQTTVDQLGRTTLIESSEDGASYTISSETHYIYMPAGGIGFVTFTRNAHRATSDNMTEGWTRTTQDQLGRVVEVATFDGASQPPNTDGNYNGHVVTAYDGNQTTVTDQGGKVRRTIVDGTGRVTQAIEDPLPSGLNYSTAYNYDALNNLLSVTQGVAGQQQQHLFTYDNLSRLTSAKNPEQINSTTASGQMVDTVYEYDDSGNLKKRTNPNGSTVTFTYDGLNRVLSRTLSSGESYSYVFDSLGVTNGQGRLASVTKAGGDGCYYDSYDEVGKVTASHQVTDGTAYGFQYGYDLAGSLTWEKYPSGREVTTTYDNLGRLSTVNGIKSGEGNKAYASQYLYTPQGAVRSVTFGNNVVEQTSYNGRLQPTKIEAKKDNAILLGLDYTYGTSASTNNDNIATQTIRIGTSTSFNQSFTYDGANRLLTAQESSGPVWKQAFDYDRFGNRTFNVATTGNVLGENVTISVASNRISTGGYSYDFSGNLTAAPGKSFGYDAENHQVSFTTGGITYNYTYDGEGHRIKVGVSGGTATVMVYDVDERLVAEYTTGSTTGSGTSYLTADHLGSTRLVTDGNGVVKARHDYLPFGEENTVNGRGSIPGYSATDPTRQKFTAKERDTESGLDYFGSRYYSSPQGRFISPDNFLNDTHTNEPSSWNLYAYARNNPLRYIDPFGEEVYSTNLTPEQKKIIIDDLKKKTGYNDIHFDGNNKLVIDTSAGFSGGSASARAQLLDAVNSDTKRFLLTAVNTTEVAFADISDGKDMLTDNGRRTDYIVRVDFNDFKLAKGDPDAIAAFSIGIVLIHEFDHKVYNVKDSPSSDTDPGPLENKYINPIRQELKLAERIRYESKPAVGGILSSIYKTRDAGTYLSFKINGKEKILHWSKDIVGGKSKD